MVSFLDLLVLRLLHLAIYLERAHLAHILHRAEITRPELQLPILDTQLLILALRLYRLAQQRKRRFWVRAYFSAQLGNTDSVVRESVQLSQLFEVFHP